MNIQQFVKMFLVRGFMLKPCVSVCCSESSMFVSKNRFILKTCGRTSLLYAVEPLLNLVQNECGMDRVDVSLLSNISNYC